MSDDDAGRDPDDQPDAPEPIEPTPLVRELGEGQGRVLVVVDAMSYVHVALGLVALLAVLGLFGSATDSITKIVVGAVLALAFDTPVRALQNRGIARGVAAGAVCLIALAVISAVVAFLGPPAVREAAAFGDDLPATIEEMYDFPLVGNWLAEAELAERSDEWLAELPGTITTDTATELVDRAVGAVANLVQVLLVALALLLDGEVVVRRVRSLVPEHQKARADRAGRLVYDTLGRYFAGSLLLAVMNGTYILVVGLLLGVPLILLAAIWVTITNLIPQIGGFLGGVVFVGLALTDGAVTGVLAFALFMIYMSSENYLLQPAIVGKAVNLSPPTTMMAAIIGGSAAGVPGALIATPTVGSIKALYLAVRGGQAADAESPDPVDAEGPDPGDAQAAPAD